MESNEDYGRHGGIGKGERGKTRRWKQKNVYVKKSKSKKVCTRRCKRWGREGRRCEVGYERRVEKKEQEWRVREGESESTQEITWHIHNIKLKVCLVQLDMKRTSSFSKVHSLNHIFCLWHAAKKMRLDMWPWRTHTQSFLELYMSYIVLLPLSII